MDDGWMDGWGRILYCTACRRREGFQYLLSYLLLEELLYCTVLYEVLDLLCCLLVQ